MGKYQQLQLLQYRGSIPDARDGFMSLKRKSILLTQALKLLYTRLRKF